MTMICVVSLENLMNSKLHNEVLAHIEISVLNNRDQIDV